MAHRTRDVQSDVMISLIEKTDLIELATPNKQLTITMRVEPLPQPVKQFLEDTSNQQTIKKILDQAQEEEEKGRSAITVTGMLIHCIDGTNSY